MSNYPPGMDNLPEEDDYCNTCDHSFDNDHVSIMKDDEVIFVECQIKDCDCKYDTYEAGPSAQEEWELNNTR